MAKMLDQNDPAWKSMMNDCLILKVVERALQQLQQSHNPVGEPAVLGVVRLSGLVHSEERTAFREAARQLCRSDFPTLICWCS